jgi:hypothetical protein
VDDISIPSLDVTPVLYKTIKDQVCPSAHPNFTVFITNPIHQVMALFKDPRAHDFAQVKVEVRVKSR